MSLIITSPIFAFEVGDKIVSSRTYTKNNGATIYEGNVYEVLRKTSTGYPVINTDPNTWLSNNEQSYFETVQNYSNFQKLTEVISFCTGATLLLTFAKGFNNPFSI